MLKRIPIKVLARDFCAGPSSFTQSSVSFVLPTVWEIVLETLQQNLCQSASAVELPWRASDPPHHGDNAELTLNAQVQHKPALALLMDLSTEEHRPGMVGHSRQGTTGNTPPSKCLSPLVTYVILEIEYYILYWKQSSFPPLPHLCCCFFHPTANGQPYEK